MVITIHSSSDEPLGMFDLSSSPVVSSDRPVSLLLSLQATHPFSPLMNHKSNLGNIEMRSERGALEQHDISGWRDAEIINRIIWVPGPISICNNSVLVLSGVCKLPPLFAEQSNESLRKRSCSPCLA